GDQTFGVTTTYAHWAISEPQHIAVGNFRFAAVQPQIGSGWITAAPDATITGGYLCAYYPTSTTSATVSASSGINTITPIGCFPTPCSYSSMATCKADSTCMWNSVSNSCNSSVCTSANNVLDCNSIGGCYYDSKSLKCIVNPTDPCAAL